MFRCDFKYTFTIIHLTLKLKERNTEKDAHKQKVYLFPALKFRLGSPIFMHDPASAQSFRGSTSVKDQGFLHPDNCRQRRRTRPDDPVLTSGLPVTSPCRPVGPMTIRVLAINRCKEEPLMVIGSDQRFVCTNTTKPSSLNIFEPVKKENKG